jgi:hypothetical protein
MLGFPELFVILYVALLVGVTLFALSLAVRFVRAVERIASALEQSARSRMTD